MINSELTDCSVVANLAYVATMISQVEGVLCCETEQYELIPLHLNNFGLMKILRYHSDVTW